MNLERKNIINCDNTIQIISSNLEGLSSNELYVLDAIQNNNLKYIEYGKLEQHIVEDCFKLNLLEENDNKESFQNNNLKINVNRNSNVNNPRIRLRIGAYIYIFFVVAFFTFCILAANFGHNIQINFNIEDIALVIAILGIIVTIYRMVKISTQAFMMKNGRKLVPYIRTKEAKEINENLEGLKNYIKDFSTLKEKDKEALTLWNEYLIYSVMFGQNTKVIEEYRDKF